MKHIVDLHTDLWNALNNRLGRWAERHNPEMLFETTYPKSKVRPSYLTLCPKRSVENSECQARLRFNQRG